MKSNGPKRRNAAINSKLREEDSLLSVELSSIGSDDELVRFRPDAWDVPSSPITSLEHNAKPSCVPRLLLSLTCLTVIGMLFVTYVPSNNIPQKISPECHTSKCERFSTIGKLIAHYSCMCSSTSESESPFLHVAFIVNQLSLKEQPLHYLELHAPSFDSLAPLFTANCHLHAFFVSSIPRGFHFVTFVEEKRGVINLEHGRKPSKCDEVFFNEVEARNELTVMDDTSCLFATIAFRFQVVVSHRVVAEKQLAELDVMLNRKMLDTDRFALVWTRGTSRQEDLLRMISHHVSGPVSVREEEGILMIFRL